MIDVVLNWTEKKNYYEKNSHIASKLIYGDDNSETGIPEVSIAIPTYNRPELLQRAVNSVLALKGDIKYELIVIDDCASGSIGNEQLMRQVTSEHSNVFYYKNEKNIGLTGNWNRCIELARGKWVLILHEDDYLHESYLISVCPWLRKTNCTLAGVFHVDVYDDDFKGDIDLNYGKKLGKNQLILQSLRKGKPFLVKYTDIFANVYPSPVCSIVRRDAALEFGGFDDYNICGSGDEKFFVNHMYNGKVIIIPEVLAFRGIGSNESMKSENTKQGLLSKYSYGKFAIDELNQFKRIRRFNLDVSMKYMADALESRFNREINLSNYLSELGVATGVIKMPRILLKLFKYIPLLALIFRGTGKE